MCVCVCDESVVELIGSSLVFSGLVGEDRATQELCFWFLLLVAAMWLQMLLPITFLPFQHITVIVGPRAVSPMLSPQRKAFRLHKRNTDRSRTRSL